MLLAVRKIAISVPEDVLKHVDRLAKKAHTTRSGLITRVLEEVSHARSQSEITDRINELFEKSGLTEEQSSVSSEFLRAAENEDSGW